MRVHAALAVMLVAAPDYRGQVIEDPTAIERASTALTDAMRFDVPSGVAAAISRDLLLFCLTLTPAPCQSMRLATDASSLIALADAVRIGFSARIASAHGFRPDLADAADDLRHDVADYTVVVAPDTVFPKKTEGVVAAAFRSLLLVPLAVWRSKPPPFVRRPVGVS